MSNQRPRVRPLRIRQRSTSLSLLALLALAGGQAQWGQLTQDGIAIAAAAGLFVVIVMMWEDLVAERQTVLTEEIDLLSERIDGLIWQVAAGPADRADEPAGVPGAT